MTTIARQAYHPILAGVLGVVVGAGLSHTLLIHSQQPAHHHDNHPIANPADDEYHVHADFHIVVNDTLVDLSGDQFQTTSQQELHDDLHLHDNNGDVLHIHRDGGTFVEFLASLGIELTENCIALDSQYCADATNVLQVYLNDSLYEGDLATFTPVDEDRILVYYGTFDELAITDYLNAVPVDACFYSGTCPERGVAPPESCGLTCDI